MSKVWINGALFDKYEARVSPFDRGFLFGEGVCEALRAFQGRIFLVQEHLAQLFHSAELLGLEIPLSREELIAAIQASLQANARTDGYICVIVTRGPGNLGPDPRKVVAQVFIIAEEYRPFPIELVDFGIHVAVFPIPFDSESPLFRANLLGQPMIPMAKQFALRNGCLDALMTNRSGHLIGTTEGSLFLVRNGAIIAGKGQRPNVHSGAIAGIASELGLGMRESVLRVGELASADEVFLCGTACGVTGIVQVDGKPVSAGSEGPVTRSIREGYIRATGFER